MIKTLTVDGVRAAMLRQADAGGTPAADTEAVTRKLAEHILLDQSGAACDDEESAWGISYRIIRDKATDSPVDLPAFTYTYGQNADMDRMLACFGAKTLATNESSAARQGKDAVDAAGQMEAVAERFAGLAATPPQWVDRTREGGGGAKLDIPALAAAYVAVAAAAGQTKEYDTVFQKLTEDAKLRKTVNGIPEVRAEYLKRAGRPGKTLDEALSVL